MYSLNVERNVDGKTRLHIGFAGHTPYKNAGINFS